MNDTKPLELVFAEQINSDIMAHMPIEMRLDILACLTGQLLKKHVRAVNRTAAVAEHVEVINKWMEK
jgi:hypothetical protein